MTTKFKIIGGFVIMIILLAGMAGIGYNDIQKSSENFTNYRRQARINVATSDVLINLSQSVAKTYDFVTTHDPKAIAGAHKDLDELNEIADSAYAETHIDYRKQAFTDMKKQVEPLRAAEASILKNITELAKQYNETVRPSYDKMASLLDTFGDAAYAQKDSDAQATIAKVWAGFADCLTALTRFEEGNKTFQRLEALLQPLTAVERQIQTEGGRKIYAEIMASYNTLINRVRLSRKP